MLSFSRITMRCVKWGYTEWVSFLGGEMNLSLPRIGTIAFCALSTLVGGYFLWRGQMAMAEMQAQMVVPAADESNAAGSESRAPAVASFVTLEEIFANVSSKDKASHTLGMKLDLELFADADRSLFEQRQAGVKNAIIQTALEQDIQRLSSISGKLFFKELLVSQLNTFFNRAVVRDIHFSSFYLQ